MPVIRSQPDKRLTAKKAATKNKFFMAINNRNGDEYF